jgi:hypothetical protein|tara:strand:- start:45051 stop:45422 length:372 start_codon:yes stop_codon:yes gene_type:complete
MKYFSSFPTIDYEGVRVKDITRRNTFSDFVASNPMLYLPYTIKEGYKPEDVANAYYGSVDYVWLVCMSNNIIDPYHQWPMAEADFNAYLTEKYREESGQVGDEVVEWTKDDNGDNIIYYYKVV